MTSTELCSLTTLFQTTNRSSEQVHIAQQELEAAVNGHYTVTGYPPRITLSQPPLPFPVPVVSQETNLNHPTTIEVPAIGEMVLDHEDSVASATEGQLGDSVSVNLVKKHSCVRRSYPPPMTSTTPLIMITLLLNNHNNPQQASSIKPAVDNDTGDADALKWIIFKNLVPPPLSHLPPSTPAPPSTVINTVPPLIPPISSAHGNHLTNGTKVWWWDISSQPTYGKVQGTSRTTDGTQIVTIAIETMDTTCSQQAKVTLLVSSVNEM
ncbi:hypothetical protein FIBSPDRAFT_885810 [Athelia psychrophila]|uniref:Uncharacterized protein n=1 Tax=Athelia psychrophila TaxID=1759441 RepID=A0A166RFF2_9AGAM|nr:hypothetical protein FIBSPDRAFT_885810 [Fibularhizoctonia sp. CBS 109695]